jgi:hypothetical protein
MPSASSRPSPLVVAVSVIAVPHLALFFWYLNATFIQQPFADMYSLVQHYLDLSAQGGLWGYLWAPHNEHRPVFLRLLTAFDIEAFSGVSYPFVVTAMIAQGVTAWLLWRVCWEGVRGSLGWILGCIVLMLVLSSVAAVVVALPVMNNLIHGLTFSVLAIVMFERLDYSGVGSGHALYWSRGAALLVACIVPFADAVGWVVWPILCWVAWRAGAGRQWLLIVAGTGTALLLVYVRELPLALPVGVAATGGALELADELARRTSYLLTFMGLPWTRVSALEAPGRLFGALLFVMGAGVAFWRGIYHAPSGRLERVAIALITFSLASVVLATIGRGHMLAVGGVLVPVRYSVLLTPLHVGLLLIAAPILERLRLDRVWSSSVSIGLASVCVLLLIQQVASGEAAVENVERIRTTVERFLNGQADAGTTIVIGEDFEKAQLELDAMRRAGVYVDTR